MILDIHKKDSECYDSIIGIPVKYPDFIFNTKDGITFTSYLKAKYDIKISDNLNKCQYTIIWNDNIIFSDYYEVVNVVLAYDTHKNKLFVINRDEMKQYSSSKYPINLEAVDWEGYMKVEERNKEVTDTEKEAVEKHIPKLSELVDNNDGNMNAKLLTNPEFDKIVDFVVSFTRLVKKNYPVYQIHIQMSNMPSDFIRSTMNFTGLEYITQFNTNTNGLHMEYVVTRYGKLPIIFTSENNEDEVYLDYIAVKDQDGNKIITLVDNT